MNFKMQKDRIKQISQILKPYVYNNNSMSNNMNVPPAVVNEGNNSKSIRQRLSQLNLEKNGQLVPRQ